MLRIGTNRASPGMVLALPVLHPGRPDHVLLKPGATLDEASLKALNELRIPQLWIKYPQTEFLLKYADPKLLHMRGRLTRDLSTCFDAVASDMHAELEFSSYAGAIQGLVERIIENSDAAIFLGDMIEASDPLLAQSTTVCFLSLLMGLKLDAYLVTERARIDPRRAQNVENLGIGALFHDIGVLRLAPSVRERWTRTLDENDAEFQRHVALGFDTVRGKIPPTAAAAVLHHHQRMDGSGYPKRPRLQGLPKPLSGSEIHVFARIIGMVELFERFRNPPRMPARSGAAGLDARRGGCPAPRPNVEALRRVLDLVRARKLDSVVFKALLNVVPAFAPGTFVTLSDGRSCVAVGFDPTSPCRPRLAPVLGFDVDNGDLELGETIDLRKRPDLSIVKSDGVDVTASLFEPASVGEFDLRIQAMPLQPPVKSVGKEAGAKGGAARPGSGSATSAANRPMPGAITQPGPIAHNGMGLPLPVDPKVGGTGSAGHKAA